MIHKALLWLATLPALLLALSVQAHEPSEHMEGAEKPKCSEMKNMDHSKMDMDDPVMQAMMKKCKGEMHQEEASSDEAPGKHLENEKNEEAKNSSEHGH